MVIETNFIPEVPLFFGNNKPSFDPRVGLITYGPRGLFENFEVDFKTINIGIIGTRNSVLSFAKFLEILRYPIEPQPTLFGCIGFPGLYEKSPLKFSIKSDKHWEQIIDNKDIAKIKKHKSLLKRQLEAIKIFEQKIKLIAEMERPDIIIISLPNEIIKLCSDEKFASSNIKLARKNDPFSLLFTEGDFDFHNIIKVIGLRYKIPTQIIKPESLKFNQNEDIVTTSWNFSVGLYYKANGLPWKLANLEQNTLYVGISFFREYSKDNPIMRASMAQIFLQTGESFVLRGDPFEWNEKEQGESPHLTEIQSEKLIKQIFSLYYQYKKQRPKRIVIYKTSNFIGEEIEGFQKGINMIEYKDFITILDTSVRFYRQGDYPVLRGTLISSQNNHYFYTQGYIPHLRSYPGTRVPIPLLIRTFCLDSSIEHVCEEIMALSRLDWNNAKFCIRKPVTISISRKVGAILAEGRAKNVELDPHYRFYM